MRDTFGSAIGITLYGESHGAAIGAVVNGVAAGVPVDVQFMASQMEKRRAKGKISTARTEADTVHILSGVKDGFATGSSICLQIENTNTKSADYAKTQQLLRPGHADYTAFAKYGGFQDARGGGHFSGRLTAPIVAAGSIFTRLLQTKGIIIGTHMLKCAGVSDEAFSSDPKTLENQLCTLNGSDFAVLSQNAGDKMTAEIEKAAADGDSVGGVLETAITGLPAGLGEPFFDSAESILSHLLFSMPAVKGIEFGCGFSFADMRGSEANDPFCMDGGKIITSTNNNGGINGGITNGMPIILRTAIKPTPSIYKEQQTVDFAQKCDASLVINGRHDPCIAHRARIVQDSLCAIGIADIFGMEFGTMWQRP